MTQTDANDRWLHSMEVFTTLDFTVYGTNYLNCIFTVYYITRTSDFALKNGKMSSLKYNINKRNTLGLKNTGGNMWGKIIKECFTVYLNIRYLYL